jgi:hypothetical protein
MTAPIVYEDDVTVDNYADGTFDADLAAGHPGAGELWQRIAEGKRRD